MKKGIILILFLFAYTLTVFPQEEESLKIDTLEFQIGYPNVHTTAIEQLQSYPSPRYLPNNSFIRLFNWMNSKFMAGGGQQGIKNLDAIKNAMSIQEELILHWNYFLTIQNSCIASGSSAYDNPQSMLKSYIDLANKYPEVPLALTTFWVQLAPSKMGFSQDKPSILKKDYPESFYVKDSSGKVIKRVLNFAAPDSLFIKDGELQKICIRNILKNLKRPINIINENGEEPPGPIGQSILSGDKDMIADKNKSGINDWHVYASEKKKHMRELYSSQFMSLPELKNTWFTVYCVEGGPIDRFDWTSTKATCSKINGNYYSTPDFYPRHPDNWKLWKGAWHGWKWINDGRKVEIKEGDRFFSPFIAAGWANNPELDIRPAQWLGLLKCLSVVGAEFYYTAYFNLKQPYSKPENYVWQSAIPAYAQAVATHFSDIFRNGNVLFDAKGTPIVTYPVKDKDALVAVRKHDQKQQYIIAATIQPSSNTEKYPLQKNIEIKIDDETLLINARRQGSVYFLDKSKKTYVFYQLDKWHQYEHPMRWRKDLIYEAEVFDTASAIISIKTNYKDEGPIIDFTSFESFVSLNNDQWVEYSVNSRDIEHLSDKLYILMYARSSGFSDGELSISSWKKKFTLHQSEKWEWITIEVQKSEIFNGGNQFIKIRSLSKNIDIDKIVITDSEKIPDLTNY